MNPKVSVCMITYNHENFIAQAIESVLMQKINFPYEIIIGDDFSNDGTRDILIEYQKNYPNIIKLILHTHRNPGAPGMINWVSTYYSAQGEYIAELEGDDYWNDPDKLQKQIDFLDSHPDYSCCFHWADWLEDGEIRKNIYGPSKIKKYYTDKDLLEYNNFMPTCSVVFRRGLFGKFPEWYYKSAFGDFILHVLNVRQGKIGFINKSRPRLAVLTFH